MSTQQLLRERRWFVVFQARCARIITELQIAISASQRITSRRWAEEGAMSRAPSARTTETQHARRRPMVEVRLRNEDDSRSRSVHLGYIEFDRLDWLVTEVRRWGVYINDKDGGMKGSTAGQFVISDGAAFFEIIALAKDSE